MDYSYFNPSQQPFNFIGIPPANRTPNVGSSEEYNASPPHDRFDPAFQNYDNWGQFNGANGLSQASPDSGKPSIVAMSNDSGVSLDLDEQRARSSSEEKESLTPAQSRRKAQNRAAQRAFRERKERHVKELEAKLMSLENNTTGLQSENERLKRELQKATTENEILKVTSNSGNDVVHTSIVGPMKYTPREFFSNIYEHRGPNAKPSYRITVSPTSGEKLLGAGATWDYIQEHPLYKKGQIDIGVVCEKLKLLAKCDGTGPAYEEKDIRIAIESSALGSDDLI